MIPDVEITSDVPEKKSLAEIIKAFEELMQNEARMQLSKEAESLKSAFYKALSREKTETQASEGDADPWVDIENAFKEMYNAYKKERAEYNRSLEQDALDNLALKEAVIADLKALLEAQEDVADTFPRFREIQQRWRSIGQVPPLNYMNINETNQIYVEQF